MSGKNQWSGRIQSTRPQVQKRGDKNSKGIKKNDW